MVKNGYENRILKLESRGIFPDRPPGLEGMREGLARFLVDLRIDPKRVILVAGTNGKGSVSATLEALLLHAGQTVGLYTSPHLEETTERFRVNGQDISVETFCHIYDRVLERTIDLKLSHFEFLTLMAAWLFFSVEKDFPAKPDWSIFEVGLGGLWDATNAIPHSNCIITSLGHDHEAFLGSSLPEISINKFGIVQTNAEVIHSPFSREVLLVAKKVQTETKSHWVERAPYLFKVTQSENREPKFFIETQWGNAELALAGPRAAENSAIALSAFQNLGFNPALHLHALKAVRWSGRMERTSLPEAPCPVYFSGDHNPEGIQSLIELLKDYSRNQILFLVGVSEDKDLEKILKPLADLQNSSLFLTQSPFRGRLLQDYGHWLSRSHGSHVDPIQALKKAINHAKAGDLVVVTGSLYLIGYLKRHLRDKKNL